MKKIFKQFILSYLKGISSIKRLALSIVRESKLQPTVLTQMDSQSIRDMLFLPKGSEETQLNQDIFALIINRFKRGGTFIEIGANDGYTLSNTLYLEENFDWSGILVEPNPKYFKSLQKRKSKIFPFAISESKGSIEFLDAGLYGGATDSITGTHKRMLKDAKKIYVKTETLSTLADKLTERVVDFISIDVEGAELNIVKQIRTLDGVLRFRCGVIEHNNRLSDIQSICSILEELQYQIVWRGKSGHDIFFVCPELIK